MRYTEINNLEKAKKLEADYLKQISREGIMVEQIKSCCQECGEECEYDNSELCDECEDEHFMAGEIKCSVCTDIAHQIIMGVYLCKDCDLDDYHSNIRYG